MRSYIFNVLIMTIFSGLLFSTGCDKNPCPPDLPPPEDPVVCDSLYYDTTAVSYTRQYFGYFSIELPNSVHMENTWCDCEVEKSKCGRFWYGCDTFRFEYGPCMMTLNDPQANPEAIKHIDSLYTNQNELFLITISKVDWFKQSHLNLNSSQGENGMSIWQDNGDLSGTNYPDMAYRILRSFRFE